MQYEDKLSEILSSSKVISWTKNTMKVKLSLLVLLLSSSCMMSTLSRVYLTPDGGYVGIVVRIGNQVNQDNCHQIISNVKVRIVNFLTNCINLHLSVPVHCRIPHPPLRPLWPSIFLPHINCRSYLLVRRKV